MMSNELSVTYVGSNTPYAVIRRMSDGKVWDVVAEAWDTWLDADIDDYDTPLSSLGGDLYAGDAPDDLVNGVEYRFVYYEQAGSSLSLTDLLIGSEEGNWSGGDLTETTTTTQIIEVADVYLPLGISGSQTTEEQNIVAQAILAAEGSLRRFLGYDPTKQERTEFYPRVSVRAGRGSVWESNNTSAYLRAGVSAVSGELQLQHLPVRADSDMDLRIDYDGRAGTRSGSFASETQKTEGTDFWPNYDGVDDSGYSVCRDGVIRSAGRWPSEPGSIKVVYMAGYSRDEFRGAGILIDATPIFQAAVDEAVWRSQKMFESRKTARGFVSGTISSESLGDYSYSLDAAGSIQSLGVGMKSSSKSLLGPFVNYGMFLEGA